MVKSSDEDAENGMDASPGGNHVKADLAVSEYDTSTHQVDEGIRADANASTQRVIGHESPAHDFLVWALRYSRLGYSVIPVDGKVPLVAWAESQNRRATEAEIRGWWAKWPSANIGVVTGAISGIIVLDVDGQPGVDTLREHGWSTGETATASTGKGWHYYYQHPGYEVRNFAGSVGGQTLAGVDFRGDGGFVVVPPSVHANGNEYGWAISLDDCAPAPMPDWLLTLVGNRQKASVQQLEGPGSVIVEGMRNSRLTSLAGALRRQGLDESGLAAALLAYNEAHCSPPLRDSEVRRIAKSVANYEPGIESLPTTDAGNAERFVKQHHEQMRYVHARKSWFDHDGSRWSRDGTEDSIRRMLETVRLIQVEADIAQAAGIPIVQELRKHAKASERRERLNAALGVAQAMLPLEQSRLDANPRLFNLKNGTLDLNTGEIREHSRDDWLSKRANVSFDADATCSRWLEFLDEVLGEDLAAYLKRAVGYSLSGDTSEHCFFLLYGSGRNGKSTFLNVLSHLFGDYAGNTPPETFLSVGNGSKSTNDLAALAGARFVTTFEPSEGARLSDSLVKQITGGDPLTVRFLYQEFFTYTPQAKVFMSANHLPKINERDSAMWERVRLIVFENTIPREKRDKQLTAKLIAEAPGILNWALEGLAEWRRDGLGYPPSIEAATDTYRVANDPFARFLSECCAFEDEARAPKPEVRARYEQWAADNGVQPLGIGKMRKAMLETGVDEGNSTSAGGRYWDGLRLFED